VACLPDPVVVPGGYPHNNRPHDIEILVTVSTLLGHVQVRVLLRSQGLHRQGYPQLLDVFVLLSLPFHAQQPPGQQVLPPK